MHVFIVFSPLDLEYPKHKWLNLNDKLLVQEQISAFCLYLFMYEFISFFFFLILPDIQTQCDAGLQNLLTLQFWTW